MKVGYKHIGQIRLLINIRAVYGRAWAGSGPDNALEIYPQAYKSPPTFAGIFFCRYPPIFLAGGTRE